MAQQSRNQIFDSADRRREEEKYCRFKKAVLSTLTIRIPNS